MNRHPHQKVGDSGDSEDLEQRVFHTLAEGGEVIPETVEEVRNAELRMSASQPSLPDQLRDAKAVLARIRNKKERVPSNVVQFPSNHFAETAEELRCAARNGAEIPTHIKSKMKRNRAQADASKIRIANK